MEYAPPPAPRDDIVSLFMQLAAKAGADHYLLTDTLGASGDEATIMAANWTFDAIRAIEAPALSALCVGGIATLPGQAPQPACAFDIAQRRVIEKQAALALQQFGHVEISGLVLQVGPLRHVVLFSARSAGALNGSVLARVQMEATHALSLMPERLTRSARLDPLSERERECLRWVSEGKTTDDIALILDVSANTVNSYITHAIHKLACSNRAMAVACAIRNGII